MTTVRSWIGRSMRLAVPQQILVVAGALLAWQLISVTQINSNTLPTLGEVGSTMIDLLGRGETWAAIRDTYSGVVVSIAIALVGAVPLGILIGRSTFAYRSSRFLVDFLRTVPGLALIPLASLLYGTSLPTELIIVVPTCVWPILLQMSYGARDLDPLLLDVSRVYGLRRRTVFSRVVLASCAEYLATGLRLAIVMGFIATVGTELVAGTPGIGLSLANAQAIGAEFEVYAYTLLIALMGFGTTILVVIAERAAIPWRVSARSRR